jgi:predicted nucleic acid-binding protein
VLIDGKYAPKLSPAGARFVNNVSLDRQSLVGRVWQLRDSISAYDRVYVALTEALDAPLLTCDAKLAGARGHHAAIEPGEEA